MVTTDYVITTIYINATTSTFLSGACEICMQINICSVYYAKKVWRQEREMGFHPYRWR